MKLGIVVVYLVEPDSEPLLQLHWNLIERYTSVPYRIYASANRLLPQFREALALHPKLEACDIPTTDRRGGPEHAYYLDRLVDIAIADGASHVAVLHVDSFPVRAGWAEELIGRLDDACVFAGVMRTEMQDHKPLTAGMLFPRSFHQKYRPTFLLSESEMATAEYRDYRKAHDHLPDSGVGYGFAAFANGLDWLPLPKSNKAEDHPRIAAIYGDTFFHLGFAARPDDVLAGTVAGAVRRNPVLRTAARALVPETVWKGEPGASWKGMLGSVSASGGQAYRQGTFDPVRQRLFDDPDGYLNYLRTGSR
jgi:hypothetical protein